ncbi:MAG: MotA/TolQ/ExbB proton channel family protein [Chitinispirillaceae bacterium]|jgi:biopolymer transport protein ExbB/TolQ/biopolymer transport protein ExbD|nr:MotA/TolQ/ExbB proton channel family protein [Chitinispirillaceae bacterium]
MGIFGELAQCLLPSHEAFIFMWALVALGVAAIVVTLERWYDINRRTDYDAAGLFESLKGLIQDKKYTEAFQICSAGGRRALPRVLGAGIRKAQIEPALVVGAMTEESVHMAANMEKRLGLMVMFGNVSTLLGLLGTVFGLIMSFAAVGRPGVAAVEKSALLASGISAAMNATLVGLSISIPSVLVYAWLRARVDLALQEIDRYAVAMVKLINPSTIKQKSLTVIGRSRGEEEVADADVTPMLNLMVILIPFLLTSSEFVKIGAIEMKLPESSQGGGGGGGGGGLQQEAKLELGIVITGKGFTVFSYFKSDNGSDMTGLTPEIPLKQDGEYDFDALNKKLAGIKTRALITIITSFGGQVSEQMPLNELYGKYLQYQATDEMVFADHESVKIVAEEQVKYNTVIAVMDAARATKVGEGETSVNVQMFPNVAIAGGIVQ